MKRWGSRSRPAKRHGRVESLDSDPHPNLRSTGPFSGCTSCKRRCTLLGHAGQKPWRSRAPNGPQACCPGCQVLAYPDGLRGSGSASNGVRCRLGTESSAWRPLSCRPARGSHSGIRACSVQYGWFARLLNCVQLSRLPACFGFACRRQQWAQQCLLSASPSAVGAGVDGGWGASRGHFGHLGSQEQGRFERPVEPRY